MEILSFFHFFTIFNFFKLKILTFLKINFQLFKNFLKFLSTKLFYFMKKKI